MAAKLERNIRIYKAHMRGVTLTSLASLEGITTSRVYQIITAVEYQLGKKNPDYINEYNRYWRGANLDN